MGLKKIRSNIIKPHKDVDLYRQTYEKTESIEDVHILKLTVFSDDYGGWFKESIRLNKKGQVLALKELGLDFAPIQINMASVVPGTQRFWHIHLKQNEIWTSSGTLLVGLIDFRKDSKTYGLKSKVILSQEKALYIPAGVAHGFINPSDKHVTLNYFTDKFFTADETTQECRIDPRDVPFDFVKPELM